MYAYEVKQNMISISPSPMPQLPLNADTLPNKPYENVYFIAKDLVNDYAKKETFTEKQNFFQNLSFSKNIARALGLSVKFLNETSLEELKMRKTHSKFFTHSGFLVWQVNNLVCVIW